MKGQLWIIAAPSGGGKSSLIEQAVQRMDNVVESISHTTRPPRPGEIDGRHYHFIDSSAFEAMIADNAFLEWAKVFHHFYGTAAKTVDDFLNNGSDVILNIDWQGAQQVCQQRVDTRTIFLLPPSLDALRARLTARGQDNLDVVEQRMAEAEEQISHYDAFEYIIVNDNFEQAAHGLISILTSARLKRERCEPDLQVLLKKLGQ